MSKRSATENWYFVQLATYLRDSWIRCPIYPSLRSVERSHPRGGAFWETGAGMKRHQFFAVGLKRQAHIEYDANHDGFEHRYSVGHAELVKRQWKVLGLSPGPGMEEGMAPKRAAWLNRVLQRLI